MSHGAFAIRYWIADRIVWLAHRICWTGAANRAYREDEKEFGVSS